MDYYEKEMGVVQEDIARFVVYRIKRFCSTLFLTYFLMVLVLTLFTFNYYVYGKSVNLEFFSSIKLMMASHNPLLIIHNVVGNVLLFVPLGFFTPLLVRGLRRFWLMSLIGCGLSLLIEVFQYQFAQRIFDVDDVMLNTIGTLLGWIFYKIGWNIYKTSRGW